MHAKSAKEERRGTCRNYNFGTGGGLSLHCLILNLGKPAIALRTRERPPVTDMTDPVKHQSPAVPQIGHQRIARAG